MYNSIGFKQQVNIIENDALELKKILEASGVYTTNPDLYNAINDMIKNIVSEANGIRKSVRNFGESKLLKG